MSIPTKLPGQQAIENDQYNARALLLELTTFEGKLVLGDYLAQRAGAILALPQEGGAE